MNLAEKGTLIPVGRSSLRKVQNLEEFQDFKEAMESEVVSTLPADFSYTISGSYVLHMFMKHVQGKCDAEIGFTPEDVDVYARNSSGYEAMVRSFSRMPDSVYLKHSMMSVTFSHSEINLDVDFVKARSGSGSKIVSKHDLSPIAVAVESLSGSNEVSNLTYSERFVRAVTEGVLEIQSLEKARKEVGSFARTIDRVFKYRSRGFEPSLATVCNLVNAIYGQENGELSDLAKEIKNMQISESSS
jgi:hypothetical protein